MRRNFITQLQLISVSLLFVAATCTSADAQVVTIDPTVEHQTIDGFGAFGAKKVPWDAPPLWDEEFVDTVINDLGLSILRVEVPANFEHTNDDGTKNQEGLWDGNIGKLNLAGFNIDKPVQGTHQPFSSQIPYIKAMKAAADKSRQPLKVIASIWTPPAWMKYTNSVFGQDHTWNQLSDGTHAHPNYYEEFAEFCEAYVGIFKRETGADLFALSLQNEPYFAQSYQSCVYSPEQLREVTKVVGERFDRNGITTKILGPEDVSAFARIKGYITAVCDDPAARQHLDILAVHAYGEGGTKADGSGPAMWRDTFELARQYNKPLWQTKTSGYPDTYDGALRLAEHIHTALADGSISAWIWWSLSEAQPSEYSLMVNGKPTARYHVSKHFYRFVRPGAVRIDCETGDERVLATAYRHEADRTLTVVLINIDEEPRSLVLKGDDLPRELRGFVTTKDQSCASIGKIRREIQVMMPPRSVMTLVGSGYQPKIDPHLRIERQPRHQRVPEGERAEFSVHLASAFPWNASFQWYRDGEPIAGATLPTLVIPAKFGDDGKGKYVAQITRDSASIRTRAASLEVLPFAGITIARAAFAPKVDGKVDEVWQAATRYAIAKVNSGAVASPADLSAEVSAMHDAEHLYVLFRVKDDRVAANVPNEPGSHNNDSVEIHIDGDNSKSANYGGDDLQFVFIADGNRFEEVKHKATEGVSFAFEQLEDGYAVEVQLPWSTLRSKPLAGSLIGFDAHVNDNDSGAAREGKIGWVATKDDLWETPSRMGTAKLSP